LGLLYFNGQGVPQDYAEAFKWLRQAAVQGQVQAQALLGMMYDSGEGVPQDYTQAAYWYQQAAEQGQVQAQYLPGLPGIMYFLGIMYYKGRGVPQDYTQAAHWYRQAAEQGQVQAQAALGAMYFRGEGVPQDFVIAYMWLNLAAAQGDEKARQVRDLVNKFMTPAQIAEAQQRSRRQAQRIAQGPPDPQSVDELSRFRDESGITDRARSRAKQQTTPSGAGSGFRVNTRGAFLTNHHVIEGCTRVTVSFAGRSETATIQAEDAGNDLALLDAPEVQGEAATFSASRRAALGQPVTVAGYPLQGLLAQGLNVTSGTVSALAGLGDDARLLQLTAPVQPGNSGGPVLDQAGNVVGMMVGKLDAIRTARQTGDIPQNVNFAIKGAVVRSFLDIHGVDYRTRESTQALGPEAVAAQAKAHTVAVHCWR
jgi:hypothetical protein